jgi:hypothetical protein
MGALWQRAVREQARICGIGTGQADEIVTLVVNHLTHLQQEAPWLTAEPRLREAAIDETLRHAVLGEDVSSNPAQQAWARYWAHHMSLPGHEAGAALRAHLEAGGPLTPAWLEAWSAWAQSPIDQFCSVCSLPGHRLVCRKRIVQRDPVSDTAVASLAVCMG